ncbi:glycosyl transferase family 1 [Pokkaliibacter plantistimulans]|uniref:Glycosyl transferase family 1 n=1 Tax=Proteobacteria bacterium 228 TaxID=2083153 RepID=A0A2S5KIK4_9PROT|nr:rhamnan synthesis F family protein [Pokkaliibacter plantistimulans]PPC74647.1 glycosyl transferase family 1 [Pokkaliibacter plantistimulans]
MKIPFRKQIKSIVNGRRDPQRSYRRGILSDALSLGLFDPAWYKSTYNIESNDLEEIFYDYFRKSSFSNVNPSLAFDTENYHKLNLDVYHQGLCPLAHYIEHGRAENRITTPASLKWAPNAELMSSAELSVDAKGQKIAIHLHIYYADFVERFYHCLVNFPTKFDLLVTVSNYVKIVDVKSRFKMLRNLNEIEVVTVPNTGRNFGPLLVEFGRKLLEYDLFCHLHSKKSLYSGKEQTQWSDYQNEYILKDSSVIKRLLNLFSEHPKLGLYYPTSFWLMPSWVNHWTCNKEYAMPLLDEWEIGIDSDFLPYPVGGMFWARPESLKQLLQKQYCYSDFPEEPLPNDGSMLHAMERALGLLSNKNGYDQFFYYPPSGKFTQDHSYIYVNYNQQLDTVKNSIAPYQAVSFDIFDTLLRRKYSEPDYAKLLLGKELTSQGFISSAEAFVSLRNNAEYSLRQIANFQGDVTIVDIYNYVITVMGVDSSYADVWMQREFAYDLEMILPKNEVIELLHSVEKEGKKILLVSDTYYTTDQIEKMLLKVGVKCHYDIYVSSEEKKRKDNGTMWQYLKESLPQQGISSLLHIGDNVRADAQIPGDMGISTFHILHPYDKWLACGFKNVNHSAHKLDEQHILKWGSLVSYNGRYPLLGE